MSGLIHTGLGSSSLIAHVLHSPPPPREQLCNRSCSNKHTPPETRTGWAPDPPMVGIRSPIGLVVGSCTSHPGVWVRLGSIPKREEPGKTGAPCVKVPGSSGVPVRDERTHPHRPRLVVSHSTCPPLSSSPPREQLCNRSCSNKHTHGHTHLRMMSGAWVGLPANPGSRRVLHTLFPWIPAHRQRTMQTCLPWAR